MSDDLTCTGCGEYAGDKVADRIKELEAERDALRAKLAEYKMVANTLDLQWVSELERADKAEAKLEAAMTCLRVIASGKDHNIDGQFARATLAKIKIKSETED